LHDGYEEQAEDGEGGAGGAEVAKGNGGCGAGDDDAGVAKSDEGDVEADTSADSGVELMGDGGHEALTDAGEGEGEEDDAREEDGAEGGLPGNAHAKDDGVREVGVEAHAGGECEWVVGECSHEDAAECRTEAGGGGDGGEGHAGFAEKRGIHEDDVGHRDEGGEAGEDFGAPVGGVYGEAEVVLQAGADGHQVRLLWGVKLKWVECYQHSVRGLNDSRGCEEITRTAAASARGRVVCENLRSCGDGGWRGVRR